VAIENAIREMEEEAEEEILVPRSAPLGRINFEQENNQQIAATVRDWLIF
jgi:hypothetical protein